MVVDERREGEATQGDDGSVQPASQQGSFPRDLAGSRVGLWDWHLPTGRVLYDGSFQRLLGLAESELADGPAFFREMLHPDDRQRVRDAIAEHMRDGSTAFASELRMRAGCDDWRWMEVRGKVVQWDGAAPVRLVGILTDVHVCLEAAERLRQSESRFRSLIHNLSDTILIMRVDGTIVWETPSFQRIMGYPQGHLIGRKAWEFAHPEDLPVVAEAFAQTLENRHPGTPTEFRGRAYDGSYRILEALADNLVGEPGVDGIVVTMRDVTDRRRAEEQRRAMEARMQHSHKLESLGVLAGGIAHDFNNLLTGVLGHAALALGQVPQDSPARRHLEQVRLAAQRAAELTRQMLAYSGKGHFVVEPVNLSELIEEMCSLLEVSISSNCQLTSSIDPALPLIEGDPSQLRQVVMNLILNASEALGGRDGTVEVWAGAPLCDGNCLTESYLEGAFDGHCVCLQVKDNGCGMDEQVRARIFDPFFTTKFTGRGLGLAAVLGIVRGHRGGIQVDSTLGVGTTFRVFFPVCTKAVADRPAPAATQHCAPGPLPQGAVLVIDDDESVRTLAATVLGEAGYEVLGAGDGPRGLELFRGNQGRVRAVLLDRTMPQVSGDDVLQKLKAIDPAVRVILTSGYAECDGTDGAAGFLRKPYTPAALVQVMSGAMQG
jgi:PAS domain S-box-containing protein